MNKKDVIIFLLFILTLIPLTLAYDFCEDTTPASQLQIVEINSADQTNETNWEWSPTEQVEVQVEVINKNFTTRNFELELFILDEDLVPKNITTENKNPTKTFTLEEHVSQKIDFSFTLQEPRQNKYFLYAKLSDINNESICTSLKATSTSRETEIKIKEDEKIIVVRNINGPENITPGKEVEYTVEVINLGNVKEARVLVIAYNGKLKLREEREILDLGVTERKSVTFNFTIPKGNPYMQENLEFTTEYDYRNDTGVYYESSSKVKIFPVQIEASIQNITSSQNKEQTSTNESINQSISAKKGFNLSIKPYLWPAIIILSAVLAIALIIFLILRYQKKKRLKKLLSTPSKAQDYIKNIQNKTKPSTPPSKPSEKNTANTKTPPTSQNPAPKPRSLEYPSTTSSSPKPKPSAPASPAPTKPGQPQKSQPSPQSPKPDKTSSP